MLAQLITMDRFETIATGIEVYILHQRNNVTVFPIPKFIQQ